MEYKIIFKEEEFLEEKDNWNIICSQMGDATPFQTWEWAYYWWKYNEPEDSLYIIKAYEAGKIFGYAPLVVKNNKAEFIGGRDLDYGRFIVSQKTIIVIEGFINTILEKNLDIEFQEMNSKNSQLHIVQKILENHKNYFLYRTTRTAFVNLTKYENFEKYFKLLSQSMRNKTIKIGLKKNLQLQKEKVSDSLLEEIQEIYNNRQSARVGNSDITWALKIITELNNQNLLDIYIARDDNEAVGFLVSMKYEKSQYIWLVAFKQEYKNCFPGQLLFYKAIKDGFENCDNKVDFMRGDYDFKMRWECELDTNYSVFLFNSHAKYIEKKLYCEIKPKVKKIVYSHPMLERIYVKHAK